MKITLQRSIKILCYRLLRLNDDVLLIDASVIGPYMVLLGSCAYQPTDNPSPHLRYNCSDERSTQK